MTSNSHRVIKDLPRQCIYFVIICLSFFPQPIMQRYATIIKIVLGAAFLVLIAQKGLSVFNASDFPVYFFVILISLNIFYCSQKNIAFRSFLELSTMLFFTFYIVKNSLLTEKDFYNFTKLFSICSILVASLAIFEAWTAFNPLYEYFLENPYYFRFVKGFVNLPSSPLSPGFKTGFVHPIATQYHPTVLGTYLLVALPFNFLLYKKESVFPRTLGIIGIILSLSVILITFSRAVFLSLTVIIGLYFFLNRKYLVFTLFILLVVCFILLCSVLPHPFDRYGINLFGIEGEGIFAPFRQMRLEMVKRIIVEHPWFGIGLQHFRLNFCDYFPGQCGIIDEFKTSDNMYLTILSETGIIGFLGLLILNISFLVRGIRYYYRTNNVYKKQQTAAYLLSFIALLILLCGYDLFYWLSPYLLYCIILGLGGSIYRNASYERMK